MQVKQVNPTRMAMILKPRLNLFADVSLLFAVVSFFLLLLLDGCCCFLYIAVSCEVLVWKRCLCPFRLIICVRSCSLVL